jgi:hypothetical protein
MASNEFMLHLHKRLVEERQIADTTASAYIKALVILNNKSPFKNLTFLKKTDTIQGLIQKYAESTQKTIYATITSVLSLDKEKTSWKKVYKFYYDEMMNLSNEAKAAPTEVKTEKQNENWLTWEDVKKVCGGLEGLPLLILSLYTMIAPRRNKDYLQMSVFKAFKKDKIDELPKDTNYCIVDARTGTPLQFIFNVYKTAKTYGTQHIYITGEFQDVVKKYLAERKVNKKDKLTPFLVDSDGKAIVADNAITRILNKIFGKKVGSSMLRHIYLSDKYSIADMKNDADAMGHSLNQQREYLKETPPPT